jgi:hypothetical protein
MVAEKKQTGQPKAAAPQPPQEPSAGPPAEEKTTGAEQQGQPSAEGSGSAKRKPWIKKTPVERILGEVQKQEEKVAALKKELEKEEGALKTLREATKLLGGS